MPQLPAEIWLAIFEQLLIHDVHIFNQSRRFIYDFTLDLQTMQLVCSTWRDLIRPLTYRRVAIDGHTQDLPGRFSYLLNILNPDEGPSSAKASWIQTLWLLEDSLGNPNPKGNASEFPVKFKTLVPRMTSLRELCLRIVVSVQDFEVITRYHAPSLERMAVTFDGRDLGKTLPLMKHFTALQDLLLIIPTGGFGPDLDDETELPNLRLLELNATEDPQRVIKWLSQSTVPQLTDLRIDSCFRLDLNVLSTFMARYGRNLITFGSTVMDRSLTTAVFPYTPHLKRLDVSPRYHMIVELLQGLPISVQEVACSGFGSNVGNQSKVLRELAKAVEQLSHGSALRIVRAVSGASYYDSAPYTWRARVQRSEKRRIEAWGLLTHNATRLLDLGVVVLDEEDVVLTDFLKDFEDTDVPEPFERLETYTRLLYQFPPSSTLFD
ncbi:Nn.00g048980.m01.CDS01 [Neocucurbitaria sp. VM-36]